MCGAVKVYAKENRKLNFRFVLNLKMLALGVLDSMLTFDVTQQWLTFMSSKGICLSELFSSNL